MHLISPMFCTFLAYENDSFFSFLVALHLNWQRSYISTRQIPSILALSSTIYLPKVICMPHCTYTCPMLQKVSLISLSTDALFSFELTVLTQICNHWWATVNKFRGVFLYWWSFRWAMKRVWTSSDMPENWECLHGTTGLISLTRNTVVFVYTGSSLDLTTVGGET